MPPPGEGRVTLPDRLHEFVINHTDNDRRAVLAAPRYVVLGERQADGALPPSAPRCGRRSAQLSGHIGPSRERTVRSETHNWPKAGGSERCPRCI
jgi:hypothetical protein